MTIDAKRLRDNDRKVRYIPRRHPKTKVRLQFEIVKHTGSCSWTVHENWRGGRNKRMVKAESDVPGWPIRRVILE